MVRNGNGTKWLWYEMAMVRNGYGTKMIFTMVRNDCNSKQQKEPYTILRSVLRTMHIAKLCIHACISVYIL